MAFNFPLTPVVDQLWANPAGGPTYKWTGYAWMPQDPSVVVPEANVLHQSLWYSNAAGLGIPPEKEAASIDVAVKSATSRLVIQGGCQMYLIAGEAAHGSLRFTANAATLIYANSTNDMVYHTYVSVMSGVSYVHNSPIGTIVPIKTYANSAIGGGSSAMNRWLFVQEVEA